jgi:LCP family protein required for cell wall assembly
VSVTEAFPAGPRPAATTDGALNILLIGSDRRSASDADAAATSGGRSDTLMLAHIPADRSGVYLMSIMRDSWVEIPGRGPAKINAAYSWGGIPLTVQTVEQLLDIRIDHVAEIDFAGLRGMTDALGGVPVHSEEAFTLDGHRFTAGAQTVSGDRALAFVRARYPFANGDYQRVQNQQSLMHGIVERLVSRGTLTNPGKMQQFVTATSKYLTVDQDLGFDTLVSLGWSLRDARPADLHAFTMPTAGGGLSADGQSYVAVNQIARQSLSSALRSDDLKTWMQHEIG